MAGTAVILDEQPLQRRQGGLRPAKAAVAPVTTAPPAPRHHDYDWYRAEARRLRAQAIRDTLLQAASWLRRVIAG